MSDLENQRQIAHHLRKKIQQKKMTSSHYGSFGRVLRGHTNSVLSIAFAKHIVVSVSYDGTMRRWNAATGRRVGKCFCRTRRYSCLSLALSPDAKTRAVGSTDNFVRFYRDTSVQVLRGHKDSVLSITFSPNGKALASASDDGEVRLWCVETRECTRAWNAHNSSVRSVAFSPDGKTLASASRDRTVRLWNVETGECRRIFREHSLTVNCAVFSPDGASIASCSGDASILLWNVKTGVVDRRLRGHENIIFNVVFSRNGTLLASASIDQTVRLWTVQFGECVRVFRGHTDWIYRVAFSPNNKVLASCSEDKTVRLWSLLDYATLWRAALFLRVGVAPYVLLDIVDFCEAGSALPLRRFCDAASCAHSQKISFIVALQQRVKQ